MKIDKALAMAITFDDDVPEGVEVVERGEWINDGKCQYAAFVFKQGGKFYEVYVGRSGSYHTDWYYDFEDMEEFDCCEVEKKEVVTHKWVGVKESE